MRAATAAVVGIGIDLVGLVGEAIPEGGLSLVKDAVGLLPAVAGIATVATACSVGVFAAHGDIKEALETPGAVEFPASPALYLPPLGDIVVSHNEEQLASLQ